MNLFVYQYYIIIYSKFSLKINRYKNIFIYFGKINNISKFVTLHQFLKISMIFFHGWKNNLEESLTSRN